MKYNPKVVLAYFKQCGLPEPTPELVFHPTRKWRFDWAWGDQKVALEVQGGLFVTGGHNRGAQMLKDYEKYNHAAMLGWRLLFVQPKALCATVSVEMIRTALTYGKITQNPHQ